MYPYQYSEKLEKILKKLFRKDKVHYTQILNKIGEIINSKDVEHYKNLKYDLSEYKGVHIGHFVLVFKYQKSNNMISFEDFDHHDVIYKKKI